jgi:hypothetical protein
MRGVSEEHPAPFLRWRRENRTTIEKMERDVTNEQRRRRTLFKATLWAVASCLIFWSGGRRTRSLRPAPVFALAARTQIRRSGKLVRDARRYGQCASDRLENQAIDPAAAGRYASDL